MESFIAGLQTLFLWTGGIAWTVWILLIVWALFRFSSLYKEPEIRIGGSTQCPDCGVYVQKIFYGQHKCKGA